MEDSVQRAQIAWPVGKVSPQLEPLAEAMSLIVVVRVTSICCPFAWSHHH